MSRPAKTLAVAAALIGVVSAGIYTTSSDAQTKSEAQSKSKTVAAKKAEPAPAPKAGQVFDDWGINCEAQPDKTEKCFVSQFQFVTQTGQRYVNVNFGYLGPKGEPTMVAYLPLGLDLAAGAVVQFEPGPRLPLTVATCLPEGCRASVILDDAAQKAMATAKSITIGVIPFGKTETAAIPVSVKGLAAAFAALK